MPSQIRPQHSPEETRNFRAFHEVLESARDQIQEAVREAALRVPAFAAIITPKVDPDPQEEQSRRFEREALVDQNWDGYLDNLARQGAVYARMGIAFGDWYALLNPYRAIIYEKIFAGGAGGATGPAGGPALSRMPPPHQVIAGMDRFLDIAMSALATAYLETKEALIREAESQLGLYIDMFRNATVGMLVYEWTDPPDLGSFRLVAANPAAGQLGTSRVLGLVGLTVREGSPDMLGTEGLAHYGAILEQGEARNWSLEYGPAGARQSYDVRGFPLQRGYLGVIFENTTQRHRLSAELERHVKELERSNRELDDFAYVASHDLKAPLRDIDNLSRWIVEDAEATLPASSQRHLAVLQDRVGRMERLLDDLLQYSRAGRISAPSEEFATGAVIEEVLGLVGPREGFEVVVSGERPTIYTPRVPFALLVRNLVTNAIKHHHRDRGRVVVDVADGPQRLTVSVIDDGPGIPAEFHERVFRMFQTLRPRDKVEGSGIGLAMVKKVVDVHGGNVWIESKPGEGTTLRFTWPKAWPPAVKEAP